MDWFHMLYESRPDRQDAQDTPRPRGQKLFWVTLAQQWWSLIGLNILFWISCLPILTIPAGLKAMTKLCVQLLRGESISVIPDFWDAFRQDFLKTSAAGGISGALMAVTGAAAASYGTAMKENGLLAAPALIAGIIFLVLVMAAFSMNMMLAFSELKLGQLLRNSVLLVLVRPGRHLLAVLVLTVLTVLYILTFPYSTVALGACILSFSCLFICNLIWPVVREFVFPEDTNEHND